jgi:NADH:ubiquinone oxidoreductase subunit 3 (subunit A)
VRDIFFQQVTGAQTPNYEKLTSYECGEEPTGNAWLPFNSRFYVIALIFLLFDVEMVFVFPLGHGFWQPREIAADSRLGMVLAYRDVCVFRHPDIRPGLRLGAKATWTG